VIYAYFCLCRRPYIKDVFFESESKISNKYIFEIHSLRRYGHFKAAEGAA
jgi:hypothetical protein